MPMNFIIPKTRSAVVAPAGKPLYLYVHPANDFAAKVPGAWAFEDWNAAAITVSNPAVTVEKGPAGELKVSAPSPLDTEIGFSARMGQLDVSEMQLLSGVTWVRFVSADQPTGLVALPKPGAEAIVAQAVDPQ